MMNTAEEWENQHNAAARRANRDFACINDPAVNREFSKLFPEVPFRPLFLQGENK